MRLQALTLCVFFSSLAFSFPKAELLESYRTIQSNLAYDRYTFVRDGAAKLLPSLDQWIKETPESDASHAQLAKVREGARLLAETSEEGEQRRRFAVLAEGTLRILKAEPGLSAGWQLYKCTMVTYFPYWAQPKTEAMANPYMGTSMLKCGVKKAWTALP